MITFFGKTFVILTFVLSGMFLAVSMGVYVNHLPWSGGKDKQQGIVEGYKKKLDDHAFARDLSVGRLYANYNQLGQYEQIRAFRQQFYKQKLELVRNGVDAAGQPVSPAVFELELNPQGVVETRLIGKTPIVSRDAPLLSQKGYETAMADTARKITLELDKITELQTELKNLTTLMQGEGDEPGLLREKEIQTDAKVRMERQQEHLKPALANHYSLAVQILQRQAELKRRLAELGMPTGASGAN